MNDSPPIPVAIAAVPSSQQPSKAPGSGESFETRRDKYLAQYTDWCKGLNRHDFLQMRKLMDGAMKAYARHCMKIHSPPAKDESNHASRETSDGPANLDVRDPPSEPA